MSRVIWACRRMTIQLPQWPHEVGPLMTYMTSCGSTTCDQFDETGAKWFKINEVGKKDDGTWWQNDFKRAFLSCASP